MSRVRVETTTGAYDRSGSRGCQGKPLGKRGSALPRPAVPGYSVRALTSASAAVTGAIDAVILAGGNAVRLGGVQKASLVYDGERFINRILRTLAPLFQSFTIVTNDPKPFEGLGVRLVRDEREGLGPLMGLYSGLKSSRAEASFVTAVDTPLLSARLVRRLLEGEEACDAFVPRWNGNLEPLCAVYGRRCLPSIERVIEQRRIVSFFPLVRVCFLDEPVVRQLDPQGRSFFNVNSPADYEALRSIGSGGS